jgi:hypothetical protein
MFPEEYDNIDFNEKRFRLRVGNRVVGFMRKINKRTVFYSRDGFWWSGQSIPYDEVDEWTRMRDKNGQYVYEWDILYYKMDPDGPYLRGAVLWEGTDEVFGIKGLDDPSFIPLFVQGVEMFNPRQLEVFSQLYLNPKIKKQLGVRG